MWASQAVLSCDTNAMKTPQPLSCRLSADLSSLWLDRPLDGRFQAAAAAGFQQVEWSLPCDEGPAVLVELAQTHGLQVNMVSAGASPGLLEQALDLADALDAGLIRISPPSLSVDGLLDWLARLPVPGARRHYVLAAEPQHRVLTDDSAVSALLAELGLPSVGQLIRLGSSQELEGSSLNGRTGSSLHKLLRSAQHLQVPVTIGDHPHHCDHWMKPLQELLTGELYRRSVGCIAG